MLLPDLIFYEVLDLLSKEQQLDLRLVSREWKDKVDRSNIKCSKDIDATTFLKGYSRIKRLGKWLTILFVECQSVTPSQLTKLMEFCPRVRSIDLDMFKVQSKMRALLESVNKILIKYNISELSIELYDIRDFKPLFENVTKVKSLTLSFHSNWTPENVVALAGVVLPELTSLFLSSSVSPELFHVIQTNFRNLTKLEAMLPDNCTSQDQETPENNLINQAIVVPNLPYLKELALMSNSLDLFLTMANSHPSLESLKVLELDLKHFKICEMNVMNVMTLPYVEDLRLAAVNVEWFGISRHFPNLENLLLDGELNGAFNNSISKLEHLNNLTSLSVSDKLAGFLIREQPRLIKLQEIELFLSEDCSESILSYCSSSLTRLTKLAAFGSDSITPMCTQVSHQKTHQNITIKNLSFLS